jgi:hypothetical protein
MQLELGHTCKLHVGWCRAQGAQPSRVCHLKWLACAMACTHTAAVTVAHTARRQSIGWPAAAAAAAKRRRASLLAAVIPPGGPSELGPPPAVTYSHSKPYIQSHTCGAGSSRLQGQGSAQQPQSEHRCLLWRASSAAGAKRGGQQYADSTLWARNRACNACTHPGHPPVDPARKARLNHALQSNVNNRPCHHVGSSAGLACGCLQPQLANTERKFAAFGCMPCS